jgi:hypothetical protein
MGRFFPANETDHKWDCPHMGHLWISPSIGPNTVGCFAWRQEHCQPQKIPNFIFKIQQRMKSTKIAMFDIVRAVGLTISFRSVDWCTHGSIEEPVKWLNDSSGGLLSMWSMILFVHLRQWLHIKHSTLLFYISVQNGNIFSPTNPLQNTVWCVYAANTWYVLQYSVPVLWHCNSTCYYTETNNLCTSGGKSNCNMAVRRRRRKQRGIGEGSGRDHRIPGP